MVVGVTSEPRTSRFYANLQQLSLSRRYGFLDAYMRIVWLGRGNVGRGHRTARIEDPFQIVV